MPASDVVRRFWGPVWSDGDTDALAEIFDPDIHENGQPVDVADFQRAVASWRRIFPDFTVTVDELIPIDEERVVSRVTYRGTQRAPWAGLPATGRRFEVIGIDIFRVRGGRIVELWHAIDHHDMAAQLGAKLVLDEPAS